MSAAHRELIRDERTAIRRLVACMCANYDQECGCLPLDCPCYMLNKWWTGAYCKYFQSAVLPLDSVLKATLTESNAALSQRICPVCGMVFIPVTSQVYCSEACQQEGNRRKSRERMRKKRRNKGV